MENKKQKDIKYLREVMFFVTPEEKVNFFIEVNKYITYGEKGRLLEITKKWLKDKEMNINIDEAIIIIQNLFSSEVIFRTRKRRREK